MRDDSTNRTESNLPPYIRDGRDIAMFFGEYMASSRHFKSVTPYFLLQILHQDWPDSPTSLHEFCSNIIKLADYSAQHGDKPGPILTSRDEYLDFLPIPFGQLYHYPYDSPIKKARRRMRPTVDYARYGVHPDIIVRHTITTLGDAFKSIKRELRTGAKRSFAALLGCLQDEVNWTPDDHGIFSPILLNDLRNRRSPEVVNLTPILGIPFSFGKADVVDVLLVISEAAKWPDNYTLVKFIRIRDPKYYPKFAKELGKDKSARRKLVLKGKSGGGYQINVNAGEDFTIQEAQMEKIFAFALAKKCAKRNELPVLCDTEISPIGYKLYKALGVKKLIRIAHVARKGLSDPKEPYNPDVIIEQSSGKIKNYMYELSWSAKEIDISVLLNLCKLNFGVSKKILALYDIYKDHK